MTDGLLDLGPMPGRGRVISNQQSVVRSPKVVRDVAHGQVAPDHGLLMTDQRLITDYCSLPEIPALCASRTSSARELAPIFSITRAR